MKISYNWLRQYLAVDLPHQEVSALLTSCGLEVEAMEEFEAIRGGLQGIIIGKVLSCIRHPNADKLSLTTVDVGTGDPLNIVCGAPNVASGQKVLVAAIGTKLYKGNQAFEIQKTKIRGEVSEGMICAEDEVGLGDSHSGIMVLPESAPVGLPASEYFDVYKDWVFEIGLTPNRSDAASHLGVARDLLAVLKAQWPEKYKDLVLKKPPVDDFKITDNSLKIPVIVENPTACQRYSGVTISGLRVAESPAWLKNFLLAAGMRPINNIVDITNYILLGIGQPLHAFDVSKIKGNKIVVKNLADKTSFISLDGVQRELSAEDLMICDENGGMCMAGVYGGLDTGVTESTKDIFLESACFQPLSIRKSSKRHGLKTDASFRFERGTDPEITVYALKYAALLIREIAGGKVASEIIDVYPRKIENAIVNLRFQNVDRLIGKSIPQEQMISILKDLEIQVIEKHEQGLLLAVPSFKVDVSREADVVEEILRIYGYNNVEESGKVSFTMASSLAGDKERTRNFLGDYLAGLGFSEIMCNSLTNIEYSKLIPERNDDWVRILNPLSKELNAMRTSMLFGCLETILYNQNRKQPDLRLFEYGNIYKKVKPEELKTTLPGYYEEEQLMLAVTGNTSQESWYAPQRQADFFFLKACVHQVLDRLGIKPLSYTVSSERLSYLDPCLRYIIRNSPGDLLVEFGTVSQNIQKQFDLRLPVFYAAFNCSNLFSLHLNQKIQYRELDRFPEVRRDLALMLKKSVSYSEIEQLAFRVEPKLLKEVRLFDIYEGDAVGEGMKSYAISFLLQDEQKTLRDDEIDKVMGNLVDAFSKTLDARLR